MALCNFSSGRGKQVLYIHITEASNETSLWQPMKSSQQHRKMLFRFQSRYSRCIRDCCATPHEFFFGEFDDISEVGGISALQIMAALEYIKACALILFPNTCGLVAFGQSHCQLVSGRFRSVAVS